MEHFLERVAMRNIKTVNYTQIHVQLFTIYIFILQFFIVASIVSLAMLPVVTILPTYYYVYYLNPFNFVLIILCFNFFKFKYPND